MKRTEWPNARINTTDTKESGARRLRGRNVETDHRALSHCNQFVVTAWYYLKVIGLIWSLSSVCIRKRLSVLITLVDDCSEALFWSPQSLYDQDFVVGGKQLRKPPLTHNTWCQDTSSRHNESMFRSHFECIWHAYTTYLIITGYAHRFTIWFLTKAH